MIPTITKGYFRNGLLLLLALGACFTGHAQTIVTFAGSGIAGYNGDDEPATLTQLWSPGGITVSRGYVYVADGLNNRIRKISTAGTFGTVSGMDDPGDGGDGGPATDAQLNDPEGVATDAAGNVYIADRFNNRIRKITPRGMITSIAGNGVQGYSGDGGPASAAQLNAPVALAVDSPGNLYIVEAGNNCIREVSIDGKIRTIAGTGRAGYNRDSIPAIKAQLNAPKSIAVDSAGNVYIADALNYRIRRVGPDGYISTVSGNDTSGYTGDGEAATAAKLNFPTGVAVDKGGNLFIADQGNNCIRKINKDGIISTVAGGGAAGGLNAPFGIVADGGFLYVTEQQNNVVKKITPAPEKKIVKTTTKTTTTSTKPQTVQQPIANPPMYTPPAPRNTGYQTLPSTPARGRKG